MEELAYISFLLVVQTKTQIPKKTEYITNITSKRAVFLYSQAASQFWSLNKLHLNQFTIRPASWFQQNAK
jgi:hypothetical protein